MMQYSFLSNSVSVPGLCYYPEYITKEQEDNFIKIIDRSQWLLDLSRRVQHYGYRYDYKKRYLNLDNYLGPFPNWLNNICEKLSGEGIFNQIPDQVIINEYLPGQGISQHIDSLDAFGNTICSLSLNSAIVMDFIKDEKISYLLEPRSLVVLKNDARYLWAHSIAARKKDKYNGVAFTRRRRISMTFRTILTH
jgi:alkylated DNA repair dioxygenase AlkB